MVPLAIGLNTLNAIIDFSNFTEQIPLFILLIILLMFSAFFSASETSFSSVNIIRLKNFAEEKRRGAKKAVYIAEKFDLTLTTLLVGNNLVNIAATTIGAYVFSQTILNPTVANVLNTVVMTIIILIFAEIIPKSFAKENAEKLALKLSGFLFIIIKIFYPVSWLFIKLKKIMIKDNGLATPYVTETELESIIDVMETEGVLESDNADLLQSAITLSARTVYDIMTPRVDIVAIDANDDIDKIKETFFEHKFTRIPVYEDDKDNIIGILNEREFLTAYIRTNKAKINIKNLISKPFFVSETTKVDVLIQEMQQMKKHFAIVSDEYGGTSGIVTMEDALEELVGEIYDESDEYDETDDPENIIDIDTNKYLISAEMELEYLFEELKLGNLPETRYNSVGGFIYELSKDIPFEGMQISVNSVYEEEDLENPVYIEYQLNFTIHEMDNRRIKSLIVDIKEIVNEVE